MALGYAKGRYWVPDDRFAAYANRESHKQLMRAMRAAGFTYECSFSYTAQVYHAEILTVERFNGSQQSYVIKHCNAYAANPLAAVSEACRKFERSTPWVRACCLEIETELMIDAYRAAVVREKEQARLEAILETALDELTVILRHSEVTSILRGQPYAALSFPDIEDEEGDDLSLLAKREPTFKFHDEDDDL